MQEISGNSYFWGSKKKQRSCDGQGGAQRPLWRGNKLKKTRGQNPLVFNIVQFAIIFWRELNCLKTPQCGANKSASRLDIYAPKLEYSSATFSL
jgi:hypothetical protein